MGIIDNLCWVSSSILQPKMENIATNNWTQPKCYEVNSILDLRKGKEGWVMWGECSEDK